MRASPVEENWVHLGPVVEEMSDGGSSGDGRTKRNHTQEILPQKRSTFYEICFIIAIVQLLSSREINGSTPTVVILNSGHSFNPHCVSDLRYSY